MQLSPQLKKYKAFKTFKLSQYYKSNSTCLYIKLLAASSNCHWLGNALRLCLCCCPSPPAKVVQDHCHKNWPLWVFHWWDVSFPEACLRLSGSSFRELSELAHCQVTGCGLIAMEEWLVRLEVTDKWIFKGSVANWQLQRGQSPQKRGNSFNKNSNLKSNEQVCLLSDSTLKKWLPMSKDNPALCSPEPKEQAISTGIQNLLMAKVSLRTY